ncbi:MAG: LptF/LptG family permease [Candidatus Methylomirabilales bacterium]
MIRTLDRYMGRDFLKLLVLSLALLVAVSLLVDLFENLHTYVIHGASVSDITLYYLYKIPRVILQVAPMALLIASFLTVGKFNRNYEFLAMQMARVHPLRAVLPIIILALGFTLGLYVVQEEIAPKATETALRIRHERLKKRKYAFHRTRNQDIWYLGGGNRILHIGLLKTSKSEMQDVSMFELSPDFVPLQRIVAAKGRWEEGSWILSGVRIHRFSDGGADQSVTEIPEMPIQLKASPEDLARVEKQAKEMSSRELKRYIERLAHSGGDTRRYVADLLAKPAILTVNFIMALLGIVIAFRVGRQGPLIHMGTCIAAAFLYWLLFSFAVPLARKDVLPPLLLLWSPNMIFGGIAVVGLLRPRTRV